MAALVAAVSSGDPSFAATLALPTAPRGRGLLVLSACANLRALSLRGVATDDACRAAAACPRLLRLDASRSAALSAASAAALAAGACAASLAVLQLPHCPGVDDAFVAAAASLMSLRYLDLSDCSAVTDASLAHLLRRRPPLACLRVARCGGVEQRRGDAACWADALTAAMPQLACLDGAGTPGLRTPFRPCSPAAVAALAAAPPAAEAAALAALACRGLPPQEQLAERRALARAWGGAHVAALADAAAEAGAGGKRGRDDGEQARPTGGPASSAARLAPWARPAAAATFADEQAPRDWG